MIVRFFHFRAVCFALVAFAVSCQSLAATPRVAVLPFENKSGDPRYDYVGALAGGLIQFDFSSSGEVSLVDRQGLDAALRERELSLSAIAAEPSRLGAKDQAAALENADYLLSGEYVFIGKDVVFTVKLVDVATTKSVAFSEGGGTENTVHALAERVVERLSGKRLNFREEGRERSLLSLRDETPGSIALHSPLVDAEILVDGTFIGYTTGDRRKPFIIEGLSPGDHEVSTDLGDDFGVVGLPAVSFGPWKKTVNVVAGKRLVVVDESTHFNNVLYKMSKLIDYTKNVSFGPEGRYSAREPFSFVDRTGAKRSGSVSVELRSAADGASGTGTAEFAFGDERATFPLVYGKDKPAAANGKIGIVSLDLEVSAEYGRVELEIDVTRLDVRQGMHREDDAIRR